MFQEAVELLLLFVGQPHTGGHLVSCTEVLTASALQRSRTSVSHCRKDRVSTRACVHVCVGVRACVTERTAPKIQPKGCHIQLGFSWNTFVLTPQTL